jgi:hypothetical protein
LQNHDRIVAADGDAVLAGDLFNQLCLASTIFFVSDN